MYDSRPEDAMKPPVGRLLLGGKVSCCRALGLPGSHLSDSMSSRYCSSESVAIFESRVGARGENAGESRLCSQGLGPASGRLGLALSFLWGLP